MQLSMRGKGNAAKRNGIAGNLLIQIEEEKHPLLIRDERTTGKLGFPCTAWKTG